MMTSPLRSQAYLAFVRAHPCCICGSFENIHAHHHGRREGGGGMGVKTCDLHTVPLCPFCHQMWHQRGQIRHLSRSDTVAELWKAVAVLMREALIKGLLATLMAGEARAG